VTDLRRRASGSLALLKSESLPPPTYRPPDRRETSPTSEPKGQPAEGAFRTVRSINSLRQAGQTTSPTRFHKTRNHGCGSSISCADRSHILSDRPHPGKTALMRGIHSATPGHQLAPCSSLRLSRVSSGSSPTSTYFFNFRASFNPLVRSSVSAAFDRSQSIVPRLTRKNPIPIGPDRKNTRNTESPIPHLPHLSNTPT